MLLKVDKGIPLPEAHSGNGMRVYPWASMRKGDSFAVTLSGSLKQTRSKIKAAIKKRRKLARGESYVYAPHNGKLRVWRLK